MRALVAAVLLLAVPAGLCLAQAPAVPKKKSALDRPTFEAYVRHLFVWGPQVQVKIDDPKPAPMAGFQEIKVSATSGPASQQETFYVSNDGQNIVRGLVFNINDNPFKSDLAKLKTEFQPSLGTPGAPVVLVLFTDFQCPYCREEAKSLRQHLIAAYPKQVRLYFMDFPLEAIHNWSKMASIAGRCVYRQNTAAFWDYHDWIFENQAQITPENLKTKVLEFAKTRNLDGVQLGRCMDTRATEAEVDRSLAVARSLGLNSTPTMFVNGRRIAQALPWPNLKQVIDFEIDYQKTAKNAGDEACCEVKIPSPLPH